MFNMPHLSTPDYYPAGILYPGGHCEGSAKPHWCWVSDYSPGVYPDEVGRFKKPDINWKKCATNDTVLFRKRKEGYETSTGHTFILEPDYPINDSVSNINYRLSNENKE